MKGTLALPPLKNFTPLKGYLWEERIHQPMLVGGESLSTYMWGGQNTHLPYMWREFTHAGSFLFCMGGENFLYSHTEKNMGTCVLHVNITCNLGVA